MADEELRLVATLVDNIKGPLKDIERQLTDFSKGGRGGPVDDIKNQFLGLGKGAEQATGIVKTALGPTLGGFGITSLSVAGAVGALAVGFDKFAQNAQKLKYASAETGFAKDTLYQFQKAATQLNLDDPTQALGSFADRMQEVRAGLDSQRQWFAQHKIGDLYAGIRSDLTNPAWDKETQMEKALVRVKSQIEGMIASGKTDEANRFAREMFAGKGAQEVLDILNKQIELRKQGVALSAEEWAATQKYNEALGSIRDSWDEVTKSVAPLFSELAKGTADVIKMLTMTPEQVGKQLGLVKSEQEAVAMINKNLAGDQPRGMEVVTQAAGAAWDWTKDVAARLTGQTPPSEQRTRFEGFTLNEDERRAQLTERVGLGREIFGLEPEQQQSGLSRLAERLGTQFRGLFGGGAEATELPTVAAPQITPAQALETWYQQPDTQAPTDAGQTIGSAVAEGVNKAGDEAEKAGQSLGSRIWGGIKSWFGGGGGAEALAPEATAGAPAEAAPAQFMRGERWGAAKVETEATERPMQVDVGPEFANALAQYGQQDVQPAAPSDQSIAALSNAFSNLAPPAPDATLSPREVMQAPQQYGAQGGTDWSGFPTDRIGEALAQEHKVTGEARVRVDVNAPPGTRVNGNANGELFKHFEIKSGRQMPRSADRENGDNWSD